MIVVPVPIEARVAGFVGYGPAATCPKCRQTAHVQVVRHFLQGFGYTRTSHWHITCGHCHVVLEALGTPKDLYKKMNSTVGRFTGARRDAINQNNEIWGNINQKIKSYLLAGLSLTKQYYRDLSKRTGFRASRDKSTFKWSLGKCTELKEIWHRLQIPDDD
jgi:hypothetical protein